MKSYSLIVLLLSSLIVVSYANKDKHRLDKQDVKENNNFQHSSSKDNPTFEENSISQHHQLDKNELYGTKGEKERFQDSDEQSQFQGKQSEKGNFERKRQDDNGQHKLKGKQHKREDFNKKSQDPNDQPKSNDNKHGKHERKGDFDKNNGKENKKDGQQNPEVQKQHHKNDSSKHHGEKKHHGKGHGGFHIVAPIVMFVFVVGIFLVVGKCCRAGCKKYRSRQTQNRIPTFQQMEDSNPPQSTSFQVSNQPPQQFYPVQVQQNQNAQWQINPLNLAEQQQQQQPKNLCYLYPQQDLQVQNRNIPSSIDERMPAINKYTGLGDQSPLSTKYSN